VRGVADRFAGKRHRTASPLSKSLNGIRKCDDDNQRKTRGAAIGTYTGKPMIGTTASRIWTPVPSGQANHRPIFQELRDFSGGTLVASQDIQYDNRAVCDPRSLDAVIPGFLFGALRRRLQTCTRI